MIVIYITHKNQEEAEKVVSHLLQKKLIACANFFPIKSMYWWKGNIENGNEIVSLLKTKDNLFEQIQQEVKQIHPYETPCILKIHASANEEYESWIDENLIN